MEPIVKNLNISITLSQEGMYNIVVLEPESGETSTFSSTVEDAEDMLEDGVCQEISSWMGAMETELWDRERI